MGWDKCKVNLIEQKTALLYTEIDTLKWKNTQKLS